MDRVASSTWDGPEPVATVAVATYNRARLLSGLFEALESQDMSFDEFEVICVDDGSTDETWKTLSTIVASTQLRVLALREVHNRGPGSARNRAVEAARGKFVCFTDDDCLPDANWARAITAALVDDVQVAQGLVEPPADQLAQASAWDHAIWVHHPSPFFETANVAYRRSRLVEVGGFVDDPLLRPGPGRHFGEDAVLGARVLSRGGQRTFVPDARVVHRIMPRSYRGWLRYQQDTVRFPALARRSPVFREWLTADFFLSPDTVRFDAAVVSVTLAVALRRPLLLAAAVPWGMQRARDARHHARGSLVRGALLFGQLGLGDAVRLAALVRGSLRQRRLVL